MLVIKIYLVKCQMHCTNNMTRVLQMSASGAKERTFRQANYVKSDLNREYVAHYLDIYI